MKNINKIFKISTAFILIFIAMSCGNTSKSESKSDESQETHEEGEGATSNVIGLSQNQLDVMKIELGIIESINLGNTLKVNGQLELPPQRMASVVHCLGAE